MDRFHITQLRFLCLGHHLTFASSPSLHYATPTRHTRHSRLSRAYATSAPLRRLKRECSHALCSTVTPHSHHQPSIVIMSSHPYAILKSHYRSHTAFAHFRFISANVPTLRAPMSPYSRALDMSLAHHCSHLHIIHAVTTITSPSLQCVCMHQSRFAHPLHYRASTPL
jgi:hypothetical protein